MNRVRLVHWNRSEGVKRAAQLRKAGYVVEFAGFNPALPFPLKEMRENSPDAFVIDLSRLPSAGRDLAMVLRSYKQTRTVPLVFVGGPPEKVARIQAQLPDAAYASWERIGMSLRQATKHPPPIPLASRNRLEGYSGTPLPKKLGIKTGSVVSLVNAPLGFVQTLGELPEHVVIHEGAR